MKSELKHSCVSKHLEMIICHPLYKTMAKERAYDESDAPTILKKDCVENERGNLLLFGIKK